MNALLRLVDPSFAAQQQRLKQTSSSAHSGPRGGLLMADGSSGPAMMFDPSRTSGASMSQGGGGATMQQLDQPGPGGAPPSDLGLQATKVAGGKSYCGITPNGLLLFNSVYPSQISGLGPEMATEVNGKKVTAREMVPVGGAPSISVENYVRGEQEKGNGIIMTNTAMIATKNLNVAVALAPSPCGQNVVLMDPPGGWSTMSPLVYAGIGVGVVAVLGGAYYLTKKK